jgi:hypothetical protein
MTTRRTALRTLALAAAGAASGCGVFLYPERKGQGPGKVDAGVVILDAIWVLVGIIPGVIAFIIDIQTGCLYLPSGSARLEQIPVPTRTIAEYEAALTAAFGAPVSLDDPALRDLVEEGAVSARDLRALRDTPPAPDRLVQMDWNADQHGVIINGTCA